MLALAAILSDLAHVGTALLVRLCSYDDSYVIVLFDYPFSTLCTFLWVEKLSPAPSIIDD